MSIFDEDTCPCCGKRMNDLWDHEWDGLEDESVETECGHCDAPITIERRQRVSYHVRSRTPQAKAGG